MMIVCVILDTKSLLAAKTKPHGRIRCEGVKGAIADFVCFHCPLVAPAGAKSPCLIKVVVFSSKVVFGIIPEGFPIALWTPSAYTRTNAFTVAKVFPALAPCGATVYRPTSAGTINVSA